MAREATVKVTLDDKQVQPIVRRLVEAHREHIRAQMLAEVLSALTDHDGFVEWTRAQGPQGYLNNYVHEHLRGSLCRYLADRFSSVPEQEGEHG